MSEKTVWKYEVRATDTFSVEMPEGAEILAVQTCQGAFGFDEANMWALVDPSRPRERRTFRVYGTGHPIPFPESLRYIDTFQVRSGVLVFHLFEEAR